MRLSHKQPFFDKENKETIKKLNQQMDYINKENRRLHQTISDLKVKNKTNNGMFKENKKVVSRIDNLKKTNNDLRRVNEVSENTIATLKEREGYLTTKLSSDFIEKDKYADALETIEYQQRDILKLNKFIEAIENQRKLETLYKIKESIVEM
mmetsp:Transcript_16901/g.14821  ORF Transcript_16901/g.14821 Transcript_16901/m.14821 type:complete len:152 (+) Transcript_16901:521-976(+)